MNPIISLFTIFVLCLHIVTLLGEQSSDKQDQGGSALATITFLEGLPIEAVEQFVDVQLNRTITRHERNTRLNAWSKKQGKKIKKQFSDFMKKTNKEEKQFLNKKTREIGNDLRKKLNKIYKNPNSTYKDVCINIGNLAEDISNQIRTLGEKGPRSHTPCSIDTKQWPADKIIRD